MPAPIITPRPVIGSRYARRSPQICPIEFRGYVAEEDIPELFQTTSVLVMPYDSSTGSSGPAHQACEYGVPIVCADIDDFRDMAADEDMAVRFYKIGRCRRSCRSADYHPAISGAATQMAEQNFAAGLQMTMASVVRNYLRWFELNRYTQAFEERRREWLPIPSSRDRREAEAGEENRPHLEPVKTDTSSLDVAQI